MLKGRFFRQIVELKTRLDQTPALPFSELVGQARIEALLAEWGIFYRERVYPPCVTLWIFLSQVLAADQSCRNALLRWQAFRADRGAAPCSSDTGSYCDARARLPEALLSRLVQDTGGEIHAQAPAAWHVQGRPVKLVDGTTVSMPDTPANAAAFGKPANQRGPSRFPIARLVVVLCLATGAALHAAIGPWRGKKSGELALFRQLHRLFAAGDIVLADRLYCTFEDIARLQARQVDVLFRRHALRKTDFRRGRRLGHQDHLVAWSKPTHCPEGASAEDYASWPQTLKLRELQVSVTTPGFRVKSLVLITTLDDPETFSQQKIGALFRQRWHAELDLRSIKTVMQMDVVRCKTPDMVHKEIWAHLLAYNLLRSMMCATAEEFAMPVRNLSFKAALQLCNAFYLLILRAEPAQLTSLCTELLNTLRHYRVGDRPNRHEPRQVKRAAKAYPSLKLPRHLEQRTPSAKTP